MLWPTSIQRVAPLARMRAATWSAMPPTVRSGASAASPKPGRWIGTDSNPAPSASATPSQARALLPSA
ncbi:MAG: hypothetical protein PGN26_10390 [Xylophilus ampelinus]